MLRALKGEGILLGGEGEEACRGKARATSIPSLRGFSSQREARKEARRRYVWKVLPSGEKGSSQTGREKGRFCKSLLSLKIDWKK